MYIARSDLRGEGGVSVADLHVYEKKFKHCTLVMILRTLTYSLKYIQLDVTFIDFLKYAQLQEDASP